MLRKSMLVGALILPIAACSTSWDTSNLAKDVTDRPVDAVAADEIELTGPAFDPATQVKLGELKVTVNKTTAFNADPTVQQVEQKLREDAAKLGASAVVETQISSVKVSPLSWGSRSGTGVAVAAK